MGGCRCMVAVSIHANACFAVKKVSGRLVAFDRDLIANLDIRGPWELDGDELGGRSSFEVAERLAAKPFHYDELAGKPCFLRIADGQVLGPDAEGDRRRVH